MDVKVNGILTPNHEESVIGPGMMNGHEHAPFESTDEDASLAELEAELPVVYDGQIELRELLSRMMQAIYAELTEMAETCVFLIIVNDRLTILSSRLPGMSDAARKRTIADWVVKTKRQVVKLYAVVRWARDAGDVQKAMVSDAIRQV